jgi:hypothetical protein
MPCWQLSVAVQSMTQTSPSHVPEHVISQRDGGVSGCAPSGFWLVEHLPSAPGPAQ